MTHFNDNYLMDELTGALSNKHRPVVAKRVEEEYEGRGTCTMFDLRFKWQLIYCSRFFSEFNLKVATGRDGSPRCS